MSRGPRRGAAVLIALSAALVLADLPTPATPEDSGAVLAATGRAGEYAAELGRGICFESEGVFPDGDSAPPFGGIATQAVHAARRRPARSQCRSVLAGGTAPSQQSIVSYSPARFQVQFPVHRDIRKLTRARVAQRARTSLGRMESHPDPPPSFLAT